MIRIFGIAVYRSTYAGEPADFYPDGKVAYVVKESGEFWTILKNTKYPVKAMLSPKTYTPRLPITTVID